VERNSTLDGPGPLLAHLRLGIGLRVAHLCHFIKLCGTPEFEYARDVAARPARRFLLPRFARVWNDKTGACLRDYFKQHSLAKSATVKSGAIQIALSIENQAAVGVQPVRSSSEAVKHGFYAAWS